MKDLLLNFILIFIESSSQGDTEMSNEIIDVTVPIQCLVKDSKLVIHDRTKVT